MNDQEKDALIERLIIDCRTANNTLTALKIALYCDERSQGLTLIGGIKSLIQSRNKAEEKIKELEEEIYRITHEKKRRR